MVGKGAVVWREDMVVLGEMMMCLGIGDGERGSLAAGDREGEMSGRAYRISCWVECG